jgi:hypothetical protein
MKLSKTTKDFIAWKEFWADYDNLDGEYFLDATEEWYTLDGLFEFYLTFVKGVSDWRKREPCKP